MEFRLRHSRPDRPADRTPDTPPHAPSGPACHRRHPHDGSPAAPRPVGRDPGQSGQPAGTPGGGLANTGVEAPWGIALAGGFLVVTGGLAFALRKRRTV
ncbi:LPXTG-motif cell wall-anchored protein [Microbacterium testaceum]|uniref:LPXTG cell wall anchor domain-containing protein n=1 Tax=Microbacterium testaceum TaxID=2033 RepID=UPI00278B9556|nr:LPXTG cell wall anchor domain-containing protein [Microbacterium testaceum]MDQ1171893.1 LPXTG-motif cell wall-anchored protein [Microbacterium testaceum]